MKALCLSICFCFALICAAQDSGKIFVVRHAEKQSDADDTPLSVKGQARAECLAETLKDAHINTAFVTQYVRTKQTAAPTVKKSHATEKQIQAKSYAELATAARNAAHSGNVLIVGHSNTIPELMKAFGTATVNIPDNVYDQLLVLDADNSKNFTVLHYCPSLESDTTQHAPNSMAK